MNSPVDRAFALADTARARYAAAHPGASAAMLQTVWSCTMYRTVCSIATLSTPALEAEADAWVTANWGLIAYA